MEEPGRRSINKQKKYDDDMDSSTSTVSSTSDTNGLKEEVIEDYATFLKRIDEIQQERERMRPKPKIYIVFSGSYEHGKSWCGLCNPVNDYIKTEIVPHYKKFGYLLWVRVGNFLEWSNPQNAYRKDPNIKIQRIPACMIWGSVKKISGIDMILFNMVKELFGIKE